MAISALSETVHNDPIPEIDLGYNPVDAGLHTPPYEDFGPELPALGSAVIADTVV